MQTVLGLESNGGRPRKLSDEHVGSAGEGDADTTSSKGKNEGVEFAGLKVVDKLLAGGERGVAVEDGGGNVGFGKRR